MQIKTILSYLFYYQIGKDKNQYCILGHLQGWTELVQACPLLVGIQIGKNEPINTFLKEI